MSHYFAWRMWIVAPILKGRLVIVNPLQAKTTGRQQTVWGDTIRATTQHNNSYSTELAKRCIELGTFFW